MWCANGIVAIGAVALAGGCAPASGEASGGGASAVKAVFGTTGFGSGEFSYPRAIAVSQVDSRVFVVDKTARIQRFSPDGAFECLWRMPEFRNGKPTGLSVDRQNRVWVADTHYSRVICFDREGSELFRFGSSGEGPGQFIFPTTVLLDHEGFIYVGEYGGNDRISKFDPDRKYLFSFADRTSGDGWVDRPTEILLDESNVLWVADACHRRICRYDRDGRWLSAFAVGEEEPSSLSFPYGMAFDPSGRLLVADRGRSRVLRLDRSGKVLGTWGSPGRAEGHLLQPWGVAVGGDGRVYCLDSWNDRVQVIDW
jgi:DNA-binding beta-propeller fold protein YncE